MVVEPSPFRVGESSSAIELYQMMIEHEETGVWTAENERGYADYMARQSWHIFKVAMSAEGERLLSNWVYV